MKLRAPLAALLLAAPAAAATLGPSTQTLEAIRGSAVEDPAHFFDGMDQRVTVLQPVGYKPLADVVATPPPVDFDSHRVAPGVTLHEPLPPRDVRPSSSSERSRATTIFLIVGAALIGAAVLLLLLL